MKPTPLSFGRTSSRPSVQPALRFATWAWYGALIGALLSLALFAPARWLADAVAGSTRQQLLLTEPRGTVWQGSAKLVLTGGADSQDIAALPGRVQWTLRPSLTGLRLSLLAECCTPEALQLRATPRLGGLRLELADAQSDWPADVLAGLGTPWNTLQPTGQLHLQSHGLNAEWNAGRLLVAGSAVLEARNMSSRLSTLHPMGSYRLALQGGPSVSLTLETLEGSLHLTGNGQWVGSRLRFSGEASAAPEREAALANLLNIIGRRNGPRSIITIG